MPHALLLSPDDQAVSAITGVLEEMSVTCERPLDGVSAAQKLNSQSFDLVLVDCENLPAAKLIFDVCRRGKGGNNPVPIAIVDGRAGLPTAFRLGAELILTKPVAKDQARSTIRAAVGRVRKDVPANENVPAHPGNTAVPSSVRTEERAQAAAASTVASQLTNFAEPTPSFAPTSIPVIASAVPLSAPTAAQDLMPEMHSAVDEIEATATGLQLKPQFGSLSLSKPESSSLSESASTPAVLPDLKPNLPLTPSDDPVLAELERTEREELELQTAKLDESKLDGPRPSQAASDQPTAESRAPASRPRPKSQSKSRGPLLGLLTLVVAGAGFYASWTYQPGFREFAQPQIDRVLDLAGVAHRSQSTPPAQLPSPTRPSAALAPAPATTSTPAPGSTADSKQTPSLPLTVPGSAANSVTGSQAGSPATSAASKGQVQPAAAPATAPAPAPITSGAAAVAAPASKAGPGKPSDVRNEAAATTGSDAPLPGESSAIILSSKGAENRLAHSVPAKYPVEAGSAGAEGTVVLKAVIDENGKVAGVRLVEGNAALAAAAIEAVKQWRYRPYVREGKTQPFQTVVIIDFQRP
jgi:TonB family protein